MEAGNVNDFLESITWQEDALRFRGKKYFFNPTGRESIGQAKLSIMQLTEGNLWERDVFEVESPTFAECALRMTQAPIWDGMTFWEAEKEMTWIDL